MQGRRKGCYIPVRLSDDCTPTAVKWTLSSSSCSSGRATDAIRTSRRSGGPEEEGDLPVDATSELDAPYQSDIANTFGACAESVKGEVQEFHHPLPWKTSPICPASYLLSGDNSSQRKWVPSTWDWWTNTFHRRRSS